MLQLIWKLPCQCSQLLKLNDTRVDVDLKFELIFLILNHLVVVSHQRLHVAEEFAVKKLFLLHLNFKSGNFSSVHLNSFAQLFLLSLCVALLGNFQLDLPYLVSDRLYLIILLDVRGLVLDEPQHGCHINLFKSWFHLFQLWLIVAHPARLNGLQFLLQVGGRLLCYCDLLSELSPSLLEFCRLKHQRYLQL